MGHRLNTVIVFILSAACLAASPTHGQAQVSSVDPQAATIAVVGVNVVPIDRERVIPNQTVLVRGDRIVAMGTTADVTVPDGALRIDGGGQYIIPGLVDGHVHLSTSLPWAPARPDFGEGPLYLANGVTTVINLGGSPEQLEWRRRVAAGELIGPTIYTSGEFINEPRMATPQQIEAAVRAQKADGYDLVKFRERPNTTVGLSEAAYRRLIAIAKEVDLPLVGHAPVNLGLRRAHRDGPAACARQHALQCVLHATRALPANVVGIGRRLGRSPRGCDRLRRRSHV